MVHIQRLTKYIKQVGNCFSTLNYDVQDLHALVEQVQQQAANADEAMRRLLGILSEHLQDVEELDAYQYRDRTLLHVAVFFNHFELANYLLKQGANPNFPANTSILHTAIRNGDVRMVLTLKRHGAELHANEKAA